MLKFSGYPYLIRGQSLEVMRDCPAGTSGRKSKRGVSLLRSIAGCTAADFQARPRGETTPKTKLGLRVAMTLEQACPSEYQGAQCAFKDSMIH